MSLNIRKMLIRTLILLNSVIIINSNLSSKILMKNIANDLSNDLLTLQIEELGINYIEKLYSTFEYASTIIDANKTITEIALKLETKISDLFDALLRAKSAIENMQNLDNSTKTKSALLPCIPERNLDLNNQVSRMCDNLIDFVLHKPQKDQLRVDFGSLNSLKPHYLSLVLVLQKIKSSLPSMENYIKQQYFISSYEVQSKLEAPLIFCTERDHLLLWDKYIKRNYYKPRNIVLLLDIGGSLSRNYLNLVKIIGKQIITYLNENDRLSILTISNEWSSPNMTDECLLPNQVPFTNRVIPKLYSLSKTNKKIFNKFIKHININGVATNHSLGLEQALKIIKFNDIDETVMILYVTRGLMLSANDVKIILEKFKESKNFIMNTFAINSPTRETEFLIDLLQQNYGKYNISVNFKPAKGDLIIINNTNSIGFAIAYFFEKFNNNSFDLSKSVSFPLWDYKANDMSVSFSVGTFANNHFGLLGIDVYFSSLVEDFAYFTNNPKFSYIFLMDLKGNVIMHPTYPSPLTNKQQLHFMNIENFEKVHNFHKLKNRFFNEMSGSFTTKDVKSNLRYTWRRIGEWYIICLVLRENFNPVRPYNVNWPFNISDAYNIRLIYNNVDNSKLCRHLNQVATLEAGSLYLSSSCFKSNDKISLKNYMAYLQDNSRLLINPGLKDHIKDEVAALANILIYLKNQHMSSFKSKYIVRRYVASYSGVLEMFPGSILSNLDPTKRPWFLQATEHKSKLILIPPYLDEGGAGYIVTMAYATSNNVIGIDLTYGYIYRLILNRVEFCLNSNITCFLMDDRGYLIYHPNLINPNGYGPIEKQHIIHKESLVANDILNNKHFMTKILCNNYGTGTIQRYYKLNTSLNDVLINFVHGDNCISYYIALIPNTNLFIGMVNATCNIVVTFCPCSIVDRLCLNCNRMEQKECECPCECPIEYDKCTENFNYNTSTCNWFPEYTTEGQFLNDDRVDGLETCFPTTCKLETTHFGCLGITGCEWCKYDVDGTLLTDPFCSSLSTCFNGIVGSISPYKSYEIKLNNTSNVPLSFIIVFVIGILVILILIYFYHKSNLQTSERLYLSSTQDNHLRMSDLNVNDNYHIINHRDKLLQEDKTDPVSPYCVANYRRPVQTTTDSDHGYSTMTQHDESEHLSLAPIEIDSLEDEGSDSTSIRTNLSMKNFGEFTRIPNRNNCIVVPVTVHRNMELT